MRVGNYTIPDVRLFPALVDATKVIYDTYPNEEVSDMTALAQLLGHKTEKSGTFLAKMTFLRAYGLIEGRGTVRVSEIGKKITYGTDEEKSDAIKKAVLNIPLWKELFERFLVNLPTDNFWAHLGKIAILEPPEAQRIAEQVRKAYLEDIRYIKAEKKAEEGRKMEEGIKPLKEVSIPQFQEGTTPMITEYFSVFIKKDLRSVEAFENFDFKGWLKTVKQELMKEKIEKIE
jgi:hypothetical protein